ICGMIILIVGGVNLAIFFFIPNSLPIYMSLSISTILMISGIIVIYVGVAAEMKAWKNLKTFFESNFKMFPADISEEAVKGCDKLKKGTLLISLWFLIVPAIIGFVYQVKGYFMLASLNKLPTENSPESSDIEIVVPKPQPIRNLEREINFCRNCGAKLTEVGNFCMLCGSKIN
ncbi:MAG: zinc ribbon domain-containing protein, partial [Promethearchaeota archaeon]